MNPIEKVTTNRSTEFKVALAVSALIVLLLATGASIRSVWLIPVIVFVLWILFHQALRYRSRRNVS
jgi:fatty acid desaturase